MQMTATNIPASEKFDDNKLNILSRTIIFFWCKDKEPFETKVFGL